MISKEFRFARVLALLISSTAFSDSVLAQTLYGSTTGTTPIGIGSYPSWISQSIGSTVNPDGIVTAAGGAPLYVVANPSKTSLPAGTASGMKIWIGDNPTATPGSGDTVAATIVATNGNHRDTLWGINAFAGIYDLGNAEYVDGAARAAEFEIYNGFTLTSADSDPFGSGHRKNGVEIVAQGGSKEITAALTTWANDTTGTGWFKKGLVLSRINETGISFVRNPGGASDSGNAFSEAAILDSSNSAAVMRVKGSHGSIIDLSGGPTFSQFIRGQATAATLIPVANAANYGITIAIDSGATAAQDSSLAFSDRGSVKWAVTKNIGNDLLIGSSASPEAIHISNGVGGALGIGGAPQISGLDVVSGSIRQRASNPPSSSSSPCNRGQQEWDDNYEYRCISTGTWRRIPLQTF